MNKYCIILFLLTLIYLITPMTLLPQDVNTYEPVDQFDPSRNPEKDLAETVKEAQRTGKRIILDVGGDWCIWCHRLDEFIEDNEDVKVLLHENFIMMKVNFSRENKNEAFFSKYPEVPGYPHFFVLNSDGELLHSQNTGELEEDKGYSVRKFRAFIKKWSPEKE